MKMRKMLLFPLDVQVIKVSLSLDLEIIFDNDTS